jgi:tripartite ATP-independent transporter DctM subunit
MMIDMSPEIVALGMFVVVIAGLFLGHPVAWVLGGTAAIFAFLGWGPSGFYLFLGRTFDSTTNNILLAIPLFVLMAAFLSQSEISSDLFKAMMYLFGPVNGGIALAVIVMCAVEAACTGIIGASVVSMTLMAVPVMREHGYDKRMACGTVAAGGVLSILIPPSIMLVMMADQAGVSVGKLFAGAFIPGLVLTALFFVYVLVRTWMKPEMGPALSIEERSALTVKEKVVLLLKNLVPPVALIFGVLGTVWTGLATATEAAGVGCMVAFLLVIVYGKFTWKLFANCLKSAARTTCMVMTILFCASIFTGVFLGLGGGQVVTDIIMYFDFLGKWGLFFIMMFVIFILGFVIDWIAILYITLPIFMPIAVNAGFDKMWFLIMVAVNLQTSFLSPPFGYALFYMKTTVPQDIKLTDIYYAVIPFIIMQLIGLTICGVFPQLVTYLPSFIR